jgi:hypothetical protein
VNVLTWPELTALVDSIFDGLVARTTGDLRSRLEWARKRFHARIVGLYDRNPNRTIGNWKHILAEELANLDTQGTWADLSPWAEIKIRQLRQEVEHGA